jgi:hypothetical protein
MYSRVKKKHLALASILAFSLTLVHIPVLSYASSTNIPIGSLIYRDLERLEVKGLMGSSLLSSKPLSRLEAARLIKEADSRWQTLSSSKKAKISGVEPMIQRLKREFSDELSGDTVTFIKPLDTAYIKFFYGDKAPFFLNVNNNGDDLKEGSNLRAGFSMRAKLLDRISIYLNPEYRLDQNNSNGELLYGYINLNIANLDIEVGRDSMWWGSGYHGNLLVTNNASPFDMVKLTSQKPFRLPWVFNYLGLFKPTIFLTRLEEDRQVPRANLLGMRLDFKPTPRFQFGLSRVFMFGGKGRRSLTFSDWLDIFFASDSAEHSDSPINGNQLVSIDASYVYVNKRRFVPFSGVKIYAEWGAEDSSGKTKTPTGRALVYGMFVDEPFWLKSTDLRVEQADTARNARYGPSWYKHGVYSSGYTYKGDIIGHHMGGDTRDLFFRYQYYANSGIVAGIEGDYERSGIHSNNKAKKKWLGLDLAYMVNDDTELYGGWGIEDIDDPSNLQNDKNNTVWFKTTLNY